MKTIDGYKTYLVGACAIVAAVSIWALNVLGMDGSTVPSVDTATALFWAGLALLTGRDAVRKIQANQVEKIQAIDRLTKATDSMVKE